VVSTSSKVPVVPVYLVAGEDRDGMIYHVGTTTRAHVAVKPVLLQKAKQLHLLVVTAVGVVDRYSIPVYNSDQVCSSGSHLSPLSPLAMPQVGMAPITLVSTVGGLLFLAVASLVIIIIFHRCRGKSWCRSKSDNPTEEVKVEESGSDPIYSVISEAQQQKTGISEVQQQKKVISEAEQQKTVISEAQQQKKVASVKIKENKVVTFKITDQKVGIAETLETPEIDPYHSAKMKIYQTNQMNKAAEMDPYHRVEMNPYHKIKVNKGTEINPYHTSKITTNPRKEMNVYSTIEKNISSTTKNLLYSNNEAEIEVYISGSVVC